MKNNKDDFFDKVLDLMYEEEEVTCEYEDTPEVRQQAFIGLNQVAEYMDFLKKEIKREIPASLISGLVSFYFTHQFASTLHAQGFESIFTLLTGVLLLASDATLLYSSINTIVDLNDYAKCQDEKDLYKMILTNKKD